MAEAERDQNHVTTALGYDSSGDTTLPLEVDSVTNYLLIHVITASPAVTSATAVKRDENWKPTYYGISSTDSTTLVPIRTDSNGYLLVDVA